MAEIIYLSNVRLSFPQLVEPRASVQPSAENPNPKKKYSADFIMTPDNKGMEAFTAEYAKLAQEKWGEHAGNVMGFINTDRRLRCYGKGDEKVNTKTFAVYDGYAGNYYIGASSDNPPQFILPNGQPTTDTMAGQTLARKLYGGCFVNAAVRPWLQDNKHGRAVRAELIAIQFAGDGEAFGEGSADVTGIFAAVAAGKDQAPTTSIPGLPPFFQP
jgi:hypothetical protein